MAKSNIPNLLLFQPNQLIFDFFKRKYATNFNFINSWDYTSLSHIPNIDSIQVIICNGKSLLTKETLSQLTGLKMIANVHSGCNNIDVEECRRRGILLSYAGSVTAEDVAEMAIGLVLDVLKKSLVADRFVRDGKWPLEMEFGVLGSKLGGKNVGIVGLGNIGLEIAKRLESFNCKISYTSRSQKSSISYKYFPNTQDLASQSDILIICCALSDITHHLIDRKVLLSLGKKGIIVNVGRGAIIDEMELIKCLMEGEIGGAGLDVFEDEPNVSKELLKMENVVLSPHRGMYTIESFENTCELVMANLEAFLSHKDLVSPFLF